MIPIWHLVLCVVLANILVAAIPTALTALIFNDALFLRYVFYMTFIEMMLYCTRNADNISDHIAKEMNIKWKK